MCDARSRGLGSILVLDLMNTAFSSFIVGEGGGGGLVVTLSLQ